MTLDPRLTLPKLGTKKKVMVISNGNFKNRSFPMTSFSLYDQRALILSYEQMNTYTNVFLLQYSTFILGYSRQQLSECLISRLNKPLTFHLLMPLFLCKCDWCGPRCEPKSACRPPQISQPSVVLLPSLKPPVALPASKGDCSIKIFHYMCRKVVDSLEQLEQ